MGRERIILNGPEETIQFGIHFASNLAAGAILALQGDLGSGKTTFVQGLLKGFNIADTAQSPTFTYLQVYQSPFCTVYHFDLYRLASTKDFLLLGFDEFFVSCRRHETLILGSSETKADRSEALRMRRPFPDGKDDEEDRLDEVVASPKSKFHADGRIKGSVIVIEWPERIASLLCPNTALIHLAYDQKSRIAEITTWGQREI
jgi:tRNA threonylcarbamoyl adenosine modification protein YjeE